MHYIIFAKGNYLQLFIDLEAMDNSSKISHCCGKSEITISFGPGAPNKWLDAMHCQKAFYLNQAFFNSTNITMDHFSLPNRFKY